VLYSLEGRDVARVKWLVQEHSETISTQNRPRYQTNLRRNISLIKFGNLEFMNLISKQGKNEVPFQSNVNISGLVAR